MKTISELETADLAISADVRTDAKQIVCEWRGRSDDRSPDKILDPWFDALLAVAMERQFSVRMHFEVLEHFNSSTIGAIVQFIHRARGHDVPLTLVYSHDQRWQRISFHALRVFVKDGGPIALEAVTGLGEPVPSG